MSLYDDVDRRLTAADFAHLETFGFVVFPGLLSGHLDVVNQAFETVIQRYGGRDHDGSKRTIAGQFADQHATLAGLLDIPLFDELAAHVCGPAYNYTGSDGNYYAGDTHWHADNRDRERPRLKIAFYLDRVGLHSGALRVIPGSHRLGEPFADAVQSAIERCAELWGVEPSRVPAVALESEPGDVVAFNQYLLHSSFEGSSRRRMFTINFSPTFRASDGPEVWDRELGHPVGLRTNPMFYDEVLLRTAPPRRLQHLKQIARHTGLWQRLRQDGVPLGD